MTLSQDWIQSLFKAISYKSTQPESQPLSQRHLPCKNPLLDEQINLENLSNPIWRTGSGWGLDLTCSIFFLANFLVMIIFFSLFFLVSGWVFVPKKTMGRALLHGIWDDQCFHLCFSTRLCGGDFESIRVKIRKIRTFYNPPFFHSQVKKHIYSHFKVLILTKYEF